MATVGRPRQFDRDAALQQAMSLFWRYGYESTSMAQLKQVMGGISAASLYAAFGSKEALYKEAIELYLATSGNLIREALSNPQLDAFEAVALALRNAAQEQAGEVNPRGCMVVLSATNCAPGNEHIQIAMEEKRKRVRQAFRDCLQRGVEAHTLQAGMDVDSLSSFFSTVLNGISIQARDGFTQQDINKVIDAAMLALTPYLQPAPEH